MGLNKGGLIVPVGWGAPPAGGGAPVTESVAVTRGEAAPVRPTGAGTGSPLMGNARANGEDEQDHDAADYLRGDHFADGRYIADGVIGAEPQRSDK